MKTILKLYSNGDVETIGTPLLNANPFAFSEGEKGHIINTGAIYETLWDQTSDFIEVKSGDVYTLSASWQYRANANYWLRIAYFSSNRTFVGFGHEHYTATVSSFTHEFTCPANVAFVRISAVVGGSILFQNKNDVSGNINPFASSAGVLGYVGTNGAITSTTWDKTSDFVAVSGGEEYTVSTTWSSRDSTINWHWFRISYFSNNYAFLGFGYEYEHATINNFTHTFTCPTNAAFIRVSLVTGNSSVILKKKIANKISFSENAIQVPRIIEYPPTGYRNYYVANKTVSGWLNYDASEGPVNTVLPANEYDRTSDFIDVRGWTSITILVRFKGLIRRATGQRPWVLVAFYNSSRNFIRTAWDSYVGPINLSDEYTAEFAYPRELAFPSGLSFIRVSTNFNDAPGMDVKVSVERGTVGTQKHYLAQEDFPAWVRDTGQPVSIFPQGIVIKGSIRMLAPTIITNNLLIYHNAKQGISGTTWQNLAPNRTQTAFLRNMSVSGQTLSTKKVWGSDVRLTLPSEISNGVSPFTFEVRFSATAAANWLSGYSTSTPTAYTSSSLSATGVWLSLLREDLTASVGYSFQTALTFSTNTFYTYSIVYDGANTLQVYVNGTLIRTVTTTTRLRLNHNNNLNLLYVGESDVSTNTIKFIRLYNKALTQEEIAHNYRIGDEVGL